MDLRICFIGDSLVNGTGDPQCLGWSGRICAEAVQQSIELTYYNLGVRRETSLQIEARWPGEVAPRLPDDCSGRLVFSFGVNDTTQENGAPRVDPEASVACLHRILERAQALYPVLMVGPPPIADPAQNVHIGHLSEQFAEACQAINVPYLEVYRSLLQSPLWMQEVNAGDGAHPSSVGYSLLADWVSQWRDWRDWFC